MDYPRMVFPGGDPAREYRIVADEAEEKAAAREGFCIAYSKPAKGPGRTDKTDGTPKAA